MDKILKPISKLKPKTPGLCFKSRLSHSEIGILQNSRDWGGRAKKGAGTRLLFEAREIGFSSLGKSICMCWGGRQWLLRSKGLLYIGDFPIAQMIKNLPAMQETWVWSQGQEDPLEKEMTTGSSILAWKISRTESIMGYSGRCHKELDTTEWTHTQICCN